MSNSVKVKKKNRVLEVSMDRLAGFLNQGYDQINTDGAVIKHATGGRTVSLPEHNKVLEALEALKLSQGDGEEFEKLQEAHQRLANEKDALFLEHEELKKENATLKGQVTKLQNASKK